MMAHLSARHFLTAVAAFWTAAAFGGVHTAQLNLIIGAVFLFWLNPAELSGCRRLFWMTAAAAAVLLTFFLSAKVYGAWLFALLSLGMAAAGRFQFPLANGIRLIIWCGAFFNLSFVTNTAISDVQYDFASCYNYIEYIMENKLMFWRENPLETRPSYSAYHPILHFWLAAGIIRLGELLTASRTAANEAVQVLFCSYMLWFYIIAARILAFCRPARGTALVIMAFLVFFPIYNAIAGYVNNDCLLLPLQAGTVYYSLLYYQDGGKKNLAFILLFATAAAATKLSGILVLPFTFAVFLLRLCQNCRRQVLIEISVFGLLLIVGISLWPLYQYFGLGLPFGFVPPQEHLPLAPYSLWQRFNPLAAFFYDRMFYNDFGINLWETMTKTALFGQWDFSYRGAKIMPLIRLAVVLYKIIITAAAATLIYLAIRTKDKPLYGLTVVLILGLLTGQVMFGLKHPFMCNQDFRYVAVLPLSAVMLFGQLSREACPKVLYALCAVLGLFAFVSALMWQWIL